MWWGVPDQDLSAVDPWLLSVLLADLPLPLYSRAKTAGGPDMVNSGDDAAPSSGLPVRPPEPIVGGLGTGASTRLTILQPPRAGRKMLGRGLLTSSRLAVCQQPARSFGRKASKMKVVLSKVRGCPRCSQLQYWSTPCCTGQPCLVCSPPPPSVTDTRTRFMLALCPAHAALTRPLSCTVASLSNRM